MAVTFYKTTEKCVVCGDRLFVGNWLARKLKYCLTCMKIWVEGP